MRAKCRGVKRDGSQCTVAVDPPQSYCWWHAPENSAKRQKAAARGGKAKASRVGKELHALLEDLTKRVIDGELETSRGAVANQLIGTRIRLLEFQRRLREVEEFANRIEVLEQAQQQKAGNRWQA